MSRIAIAALCIASVSALSACQTESGSSTASRSAPAMLDDVEPQAQAHAHNDYEHDRPLLDALEHGFTSFEADVWLVDGELLIAHDEEDLMPGRTLETLYLDPLTALAEAHGGQVFPAGSGDPLTLLIDIKSEGEPTYAAISDVLAGYPELMTRFEGGETVPGAVTAVISGNRPREMMEAEDPRYAGYDGRMSDLESDTPASFMPLLSDNWTNHFTWMGEGEMPADERARLEQIVETAHANGWELRFWATPDKPGAAREVLWTVLRDTGVDKINTDDLAGLQAFLSGM